MKVTYIHHSSFSVELDTCTLLFDYYKGELPKFDNNNKIYVFSSHSHHDHFDKVIFDLEKQYNDVTYILSNDIKDSSSKNTYFVKSNESIDIDDLNIRTLESSDLGVAFIVEVEGKRIYHAGDLNWWHWEGEPDEDNKEAAFKFTKEVDKIKGTVFDVAFIPLDPRQESKYYLGFDYFMKNTNTKVAFPMHCWSNYSVIDLLINSEHAVDYRDSIVKISKENEVFIID